MLLLEAVAKQRKRSEMDKPAAEKNAFERCQTRHADAAKTWVARPCGSDSVRSLRKKRMEARDQGATKPWQHWWSMNNACLDVSVYRQFLSAACLESVNVLRMISASRGREK